jgi:uncharacterized cupin superfamily protein
MTSIHEPQFDDANDRQGFRNRRSRLGRQAGAERLGASLYEVEPGNATFPYHYHLGNEELLVVLRGRPHVRTREGWRQLEEGDVVAFPVGEGGAHQIANRSEGVVRFLILSEMVGPDVVVYPDSKKIGASENAPGSSGDRRRWNFRSRDSVDYWEDERPPEIPS